jgi:hypothetical protein
VRLAIRTKVLADITDHFEKRTISDDKFALFSAGLLDDDREYCEKIRYKPSNPEFMTDEDLIEEEKKLKEMLKVIGEEKKFRKLAPKIKVFKNVVSFIERMDNLAVSYWEEEDDNDLNLTPPARSHSPKKRCSLLSSSSVRTVLSPEPSDPTGMTIVASSATAVRIADVVINKELMGEEEDN